MAGTPTVFCAQNTLDTDTLFTLDDVLRLRGKNAIRQELGLPQDCLTLLFVGRLIRQKGTDLLIDIFAELRRRRDTSLLIIGAGPERARMENRIRALGLKGVEFFGEIRELRASAPYFAAADLLVNPGYLGLSITHALAFGLPVVTHAGGNRQRLHSPEIAYLIDGVNGGIAKDASVPSYMEAIDRIAEALPGFSKRARAYSRDYLSMDNMVRGLFEAVTYLEGGMAPSSESER